MAPRRKENVAATSGESLPNQEKTHVPEIEEHEKTRKEVDMHNAGIPAACAQASNQLGEELTSTRIEEISLTMSKMMFDCLKTLLSKPNQFVQAENNTMEK